MSELNFLLSDCIEATVIQFARDGSRRREDMFRSEVFFRLDEVDCDVDLIVLDLYTDNSQPFSTCDPAPTVEIYLRAACIAVVDLSAFDDKYEVTIHVWRRRGGPWLLRQVFLGPQDIELEAVR